MEHRDGQKPRVPSTGNPQHPLSDDVAPDGFEDFTLAPLDDAPRPDPSSETDLSEFEVLPDEMGSEFPLAEPLADFATMDFGDDISGSEAPTTAEAATAEAATARLAGNTGRMVTAVTVESDGSEVDPSVDADLDATLAETATVPLRRKFLLSAAPSWLISLLVHVGLILILAAITLDPVNKVLNILQASESEALSDIENFDLASPSLDALDVATDEPLSVPTPSITPVVSMPTLQTPVMDVNANLQALDMNSLTESILPSSMLSSSAMAQMSTALNSRSTAQKSEMLEKFGGNAASEKAVALALKWIADHQARSGEWTFVHTAVCRNQCANPGDLAAAKNGATAMALLPFLGAGQTHMEGQYKETVMAGLSFLIKNMQFENKALPQGSWHEPGGRMYSHGLAAITVCEAYAMTHDPSLLQPAQLSLNYLINSQDPRGGGWRYEPGQPGDTSVVGWCVMALKSGKMGHLVVPQYTLQKASNFLDFVSTNRGAYYGYDEPTAEIDGRAATTSVGLLCRMYMGVPKEHPGMKEGIAFLSKRGPRTSDLYYSYYATQVMRQHGGPEWEKWNTKMRDDLLKLQVTEGHAAGSWYTEGGHSEKGGRLYATSLATMILEVYYRHMPLYSEKSSIDDFEI